MNLQCVYAFTQFQSRLRGCIFVQIKLIHTKRRVPLELYRYGAAVVVHLQLDMVMWFDIERYG